MLEVAAQQPYPQLVENHIIDRLELTATTDGQPSASGTALGYRHGQLVTPWQPHTMPGTGDIYSSATDLARFVTALHSGMLLRAQIQPLLHRFAVSQRSEPQPLALRDSGDQPTTRIASTR